MKVADVELTPSEIKIQREIASSLVGLVGISTSTNGEDAQPLGSATLVTINGRSGLLTAAHVLNVLPRDVPVGIVRFTSANVERLIVEFNYALRITIGRANENSQGPDLGFIELPREAKASLEARGNVFFNMDRRRNAVISGRYETKPYLHCAVGMVAEWTRESLGLSTRTKHIEASNVIGKVGVTWTHAGFDLVEFEPIYSDEERQPSTYGGMSGGSLWRVMGVLENGMFSAADKILVGVVFYETASVDGKRTLICHGPQSLYSKLYEGVPPA